MTSMSLVNQCYSVARILVNEMNMMNIVCPTPHTSAYKEPISNPDARYTPAIAAPGNIHNIVIL